MGAILMKKSFALFIVILLLIIFSSLSLFIVENHTINSNIDKYKYFHLQAKLHAQYIGDYIEKYKTTPIWDNNAEKYNIDIVKSDDNKTFDIFISPKEDVDVRIHQQVILP